MLPEASSKKGRYGWQPADAEPVEVEGHRQEPLVALRVEQVTARDVGPDRRVLEDMGHRASGLRECANATPGPIEGRRKDREEQGIAVRSGNRDDVSALVTSRWATATDLPHPQRRSVSPTRSPAP